MVLEFPTLRRTVASRKLDRSWQQAFKHESRSSSCDKAAHFYVHITRLFASIFSVSFLEFDKFPRYKCKLCAYKLHKSVLYINAMSLAYHKNLTLSIFVAVSVLAASHYIRIAV